MLLNFHSNKLFFAEIFTGLSILSELRDIAGGQWMFQMFQTMLENYTKHSCDCYFEKFTKSERRIATTRDSSFDISPPLPKADPARAAESSAQPDAETRACRARWGRSRAAGCRTCPARGWDTFEKIE